MTDEEIENQTALADEALGRANEMRASAKEMIVDADEVIKSKADEVMHKLMDAALQAVPDYAQVQGVHRITRLPCRPRGKGEPTASVEVTIALQFTTGAEEW